LLPAAGLTAGDLAANLARGTSLSVPSLFSGLRTGLLDLDESPLYFTADALSSYTTESGAGFEGLEGDLTIFTG
jgi:hypothetical protein